MAFDEVGLDWQRYVRFDDRYIRPSEVDSVIGDASKASAMLAWNPQVHARELIKIMVTADIQALENGHDSPIDRPAVPGWYPQSS